MAFLTNPSIQGPLNELTSPYGIRLTGQLVNATISIWTKTPSEFMIAEGRVTSSDQRFPLRSGVSLRADMQLYAMQELNGASSVRPAGGSDLFTLVQRPPQSASEVKSIAFRSQLYICGRFLWVTGAIPGATVEIWSDAPELLGSGPCLEGDARIALDNPIPRDFSVAARQVVGSFPPGFSRPIRGTDIPFFRNTRALPPPRVEDVRGCDASIFVSGVYDGALVTLATPGTGTIIAEAGFELGKMELILPRPFRQGDRFVIRQNVYEKCERLPISSTIEVGPMEPIEAPVVASPLCQGGRYVSISNLRPGAKVHIVNNSNLFTGQARPDVFKEDIEPFLVAPLEIGEVIVTQELCRVISGPSNIVRVNPHREHYNPCELVPLLFECAKNVSVRNIEPPSTIEVCAIVNGNLSPISHPISVNDTQYVVRVTPHLSFPQELVIRQWACSDRSILSDRVKTQPFPGLPEVFPSTPILAGDKYVEVVNTIPGAGVEVYVDRQRNPSILAGRTEANNLASTLVPVALDLQIKDRVSARQYLCEDASSIDRQPAVVDVVAPPRPFWICAHNPNSLRDTKTALSQGVNAIGPDINIFEDGRLCISHGTGGSGTLDLVSYLDGLHALALDYPALCLVSFDCKEPSWSSENGLQILRAIRKHLTFNLPNLSVMISIPSLAGIKIFDKIHSVLGTHEGLLIDEENDPAAVSSYFVQAGINNACYGNGNYVQTPILIPRLRPSIEVACGLRDRDGVLKWVYEWVTNVKSTMREYIWIGVDCIMCDLSPSFADHAGVYDLQEVLGEPQFASVIRMATRDDNPFRPACAAYELTVQTGDVRLAGTDSNIKFILEGANGSVSWDVDADLQDRMERNYFDHVSISSADLGQLNRLSISKSGGGLDGDWYLDKIIINSWRFGIRNKEVIFQQWIDNSVQVNRPIT